MKGRIVCYRVQEVGVDTAEVIVIVIQCVELEAEASYTRSVRHTLTK